MYTDLDRIVHQSQTCPTYSSYLQCAEVIRLVNHCAIFHDHRWPVDKTLRSLLTYCRLCLYAPRSGPVARGEVFATLIAYRPASVTDEMGCFTADLDAQLHF